MNAIDTNIFAYLFDSSAPAKKALAQKLLEGLILRPHETVMLWQVASEFLACLRKVERKGLLGPEQLKVSFREVLQLFPLKFPSLGGLERALALYELYSLSHWDSLLIAACQESGVTRLYTEDMQHGANYSGVNIFNPFL
jgi:predicted nucleic acid-binding protein